MKILSPIDCADKIIQSADYRFVTDNEKSKWNAKSYSVSTKIGDGISTEFIITHNLGTLDVIVSFREIETNEIVYIDSDVIDINRIKIMFLNAPALNQFQATISGSNSQIETDGTIVYDGGTF